MRYDSFLLVALMRPGGGSGVFLKLRLRRYSSSAISSSAVAAYDRQDFSRDVARAMRRCEEDIRRRDFLRLCGPFHRRVGAEFTNILRLLVGRVQRCPDRSRRYRINTDA